VERNDTQEQRPRSQWSARIQKDRREGTGESTATNAMEIREMIASMQNSYPKACALAGGGPTQGVSQRRLGASRSICFCIFHLCWQASRDSRDRVQKRVTGMGSTGNDRQAPGKCTHSEWRYWIMGRCDCAGSSVSVFHLIPNQGSFVAPLCRTVWRGFRWALL
jgi:hypothetical protein